MAFVVFPAIGRAYSVVEKEVVVAKRKRQLVEAELRKADLQISAQSGYHYETGLGYGSPLEEWDESSYYEEGEEPNWGRALSQLQRNN
ncbi:hypothetical protein HYW46_03355 [Candidatus Daviesbacteria bacterium]|nr:hypothetical protein [Candidatus Daviesbacteria bacterium]